MNDIKYIDLINDKYQSMGFPAYRWTVNRNAPFTPLTKPLAECRVSLLTTGGLSRLGAKPWNPDARNDLRLDAIDSRAPEDDFQVFDNYYDDGNVKQDINCLFPIERLRELANEGVIGEVARNLWSGFMGRTYIREQVRDVAAPAFAKQLAEEDVDLLILAPACPLDHQTAGIVARVVEETGLPTVMVAVVRDITVNVCPPRTLFVNFPTGSSFGKPGDHQTQRQILISALELAASAVHGGVVRDLSLNWGGNWTPYLGNSDVEYQKNK